MIIKRLQPEQKPVEGDYRFENHFAWWPKKVGNEIIWLEKYVKVFQLIRRKRTHIFSGVILNVVGCGWDLVDVQKRDIVNKIDDTKMCGGEPLNTSKNAIIK